MADHKKEVTLTDLQQKILSNDLYNTSIVTGKQYLLVEFPIVVLR